MKCRRSCVIVAAVFALLLGCAAAAAAGGVTHDTGDRIIDAMAASSDAINDMISNKRINGAKAGIAYAKLTTNRAADPHMFGGNKRKLQEQGYVVDSTDDRITNSMGAVHDAILAATTTGAKTARVASQKGIAYAKLTTNRAADPYMFGGNRKLLAGPTTSTDDRITASMAAVHDAVLASTDSPASARRATAKGISAAKMTTNRAADLWQFGDRRRKLQGGATTDAGDRITSAIGAAQDAIAEATTIKSNARAATTKALSAAKMTTNRAADLWQFGNKRKLQGGATTDTGDRITSAIGAAQDAIAEATTIKSNARSATTKALSAAKMTTNRAADLWQFGNKRRLLAGPTTSTDDRITASMAAVHDAVLASTDSPAGARRATAKGISAAKMTTNRAADLWQFGDKRRKLQGGATTDAGDRITSAIGAAQDAIAEATTIKSNARSATTKALSAAKMTTNRAADLWQFGNKH